MGEERKKEEEVRGGCYYQLSLGLHLWLSFIYAFQLDVPWQVKNSLEAPVAKV